MSETEFKDESEAIVDRLLRSQALLDNYLDATFGKAEESPDGDAMLERALKRRQLRREGKRLCGRCQRVDASGDKWTNPELCISCVSVVTDIQEDAYGRGREAFLVGEPRDSNPYGREVEGDMLLRHDHWDSGWTDAVGDGKPRVKP